MSIRVRFAPSPTGMLHIGSARTALFNWVFARHHQGKFLLRIEDTDRARSTQEAIDVIFESLRWLGIDWDEVPIYQSQCQERHKQIVEQLLDLGAAYYCYHTPDELQALRDQAKAQKISFHPPRTYRDHQGIGPDGVDPVVRLKAPLEGQICFDDQVQGSIAIDAKQLDDMVLLRADGTPTYMLAAVVDDHDMGITHVIRGDDHLNNVARQIVLYEALGWEVPQWAHIPLIHGDDGAKLSKRHGALGVEAYRQMGYLSDGLVNYLLRLGWSHGDDEIFSLQQAVVWFDLEQIGKSPARLDLAKLDSVNAHYFHQLDDNVCADLVLEHVRRHHPEVQLSQQKEAWVRAGMAHIKPRAKHTADAVKQAMFYMVDTPLELSSKAIKQRDQAVEYMNGVVALIEHAPWQREMLMEQVTSYANQCGVKMGVIAGGIRVRLCYSEASPSVFDVCMVLGKDEVLRRLS